MKNPLTLTNARVCELLIFLFFSKVRSRSTLGCYIIEITASISSNDVPSATKLLYTSCRVGNPGPNPYPFDQS